MIQEFKHSVGQLCSYQDRSINQSNQDQIFGILSSLLDRNDIVKEKQEFYAPIHFLQVIFWLFFGFIFSMCLYWIGFSSIGVFLSLFFLINAFCYFDWRVNLLTSIPPLIKTFNFIAKQENSKIHQPKIIFMAHWDTAPITFPYRPKMIKNLRLSMILGVVILFILTALMTLDYFGFKVFKLWVGLSFIAYFMIQLFLLFIDFLKHGYSNGANDNATGCAIAIALAKHFWNQNLDQVKIELCITGAEEIGMIGSKKYLDSLDKNEKQNTFIINFDTLGFKYLQLISQTGTFTKVKYKSKLFDIASAAIKESNDKTRIAKYKTADVDTSWFARADYNCISFISHNQEGLPTNIHRPEDKPGLIDWSTLEQAYLLSKNICEKIIDQHGVKI